jgi:hypothetical protein
MKEPKNKKSSKKFGQKRETNEPKHALNGQEPAQRHAKIVVIT